MPKGVIDTLAADPRWLRLLPRGVRKQLSQRPMLRRILVNIAWLIGDKLIRLGVGVWISASIARHLGPDQFGALNYAMALVALFTAFSVVGLTDIVVRDLVRMPERSAVILASAFWMRIVGGLFVLLLSAGTIGVLDPGDHRAMLLVLIVGAGPLLQTMDLVDQQYQALNQVRAIVVIRNVSFALISIARVVALLAHATITVFAILATAEFLVVGAMMWRYAHGHGRGLSPGAASFAECQRLFRDAWPLLVRLVAIGIYMRIDQVLIGQLLGDRQVGMYAAAARISEIWYLVPVMVMTGVVPRLAHIHSVSKADYERQLVIVMRSLFWASVGVALFMTIAAPFVVRLFYGAAFGAAATVLAVHVWAGLFVALGCASSAWFVNEGLTRYGLYQAVAGAICGVAVNLVLIPAAGIVGAAVTVLISYFVSAFLFNLLFPATRPIFRLQLRAIGFR